MTDERELERLADELESIERAIIDTSSLVYCTSCGALDPLLRAVKLITVPQVIEEFGTADLPIEIRDIGPGTTDRLVVALALETGDPVISEDRKLLLAADRAALRYYNSLIMLGMLLLRGVIGPSDFDAMRAQLLEVAHYGRRVLSYGDDLAQFILMRR